MVGKLGAIVVPCCPPMALLGGKPGSLLIACEGIFPIAVLLAGKLWGIPPPDTATELMEVTAMAIKLIEIILFMYITL